MKKKIICLLLVLVTCFALCACAITTRVIEGEEVEIADHCFGIIEELDHGNYITYDIHTKVVFYLENGQGGYLAPYQIYQDGAIYGAIYENGEIVPVPYAMGITEEMINNYSSNIFK